MFAYRIDEVPSRFQSATKVFLSNNSLASVEGITQFKAVQVLTLANNLLENLEEVREVDGSACSVLQPFHSAPLPLGMPSVCFRLMTHGTVGHYYLYLQFLDYFCS